METGTTDASGSGAGYGSSILIRAPVKRMMASTYLLADDSGKIMYGDRACHLRLDFNDLYVFDVHLRKTIRVINLTSVIGSKALSAVADIDLSELIVYDYKYEGSGLFSLFTKSKLRKCEAIKILFADSSTCQQWSDAINWAIYNQTENPKNSKSIETGPNIEDGINSIPNNNFTMPIKRYLVFVNPVSGQGRSLSVWKDSVEPMMIQAGVIFKLVTTQYANHAKDFMEEFDPSLYDCIMCIGGDGILFEIINGLSSRSQGDGELLLSTVPVAPVPGGSGNGLIKSLLFEVGEDLSVINAVFMALKGTNEPMDISIVQTKSHTYRSFLFLGWGLISDIDLLSESMRRLGEMRFYLAAVYFILKKKYYRGRLSMYTCGTDSPGSSPGSGTSLVTGPGSGPGSGTSSEWGKNSLPSFDTEISAGNGWEVIDGLFLFVWIVQTSHVTASMHSGPGVCSNDGMFTIYVVTEMSRCEMVQLLIAMDTGDHVKHPKVRTFHCTAYRLEPCNVIDDSNNSGRSNDSDFHNSNINKNSSGNSSGSSNVSGDSSDRDGGLFTLDGESVEYGPIQGIMRHKAGTVKKLRL